MHQPLPLITKIVSGGLWSGCLRIASRGMGLIRTLILARLLFPEDFGQIGIVMTIFTLLDCVTQFGFTQALIQRNGHDAGYLDTAWTASLLRSVVLFLVVLGMAPAVAAFFRIDELTALMRVVSVSILLNGLTNIGVVLFQKELNFRQSFVLEAVPTFVDLVASLAAAWYLRNVWALVWGGMAFNLSRLLLSFLLHPYRPAFRIDRVKFNELFHFGKWILLSGVVVTVTTQGDSLLVGKVFGAAALGYYQMAFLISNVLATEITNTVSQVVFPSYSQIREDRQRLKEAFFRVFQFIVVICVPLSAGVFILSAEFSQQFLGEKWNAAAPLIQIMSGLGCLRAFGGTAVALFWGIGAPRLAMKYSMVQLAVLGAMIGPAAHWYGLEGVAAAVLLSYLALEALHAFRLLSLLGAGWVPFIRVMAVPLAASLGMVVVVGSVKGVVGAGFAGFGALVVVGTGSYVGFLLILDSIFMASQTRGMIVDLFLTARRPLAE
jgi:O-antigen/teichoic acid export membrane protein